MGSGLCGQKLPNKTRGFPLLICHGVNFYYFALMICGKMPFPGRMTGYSLKACHAINLYVSFNCCWNVEESSWHKACSSDSTVKHKTAVHSLRSDIQTWVVHSMYDKTIACLLSSLSLYLSPLCVCVYVFSHIAVSQNREAQNWANGCGCSGETIAERLSSERLLLRALLYGAASRSYTSISPRCKALLQATTMSIFVKQHYYL